MLKQILIIALVSALLTAYAGAYEPGGFNGKLYAAEVSLGTSLAIIPIGFGILRAYATTSSTVEEDEKTALRIMSTYPFLIGAGTFAVGEIWGAFSGNKTAAYIVPTTVSFGVMGSATLIGSLFDENGRGGAFTGMLVSVIPNAFLNAYLYNVVKKPKRENTNASVSFSPYFTTSADPGAEKGFTITCGVFASY
jgi:hypothetical protein